MPSSHIRRLAITATVLVTIATLGTAPAKAATSGSVAGQLTKSDGTPAGNATVRLYIVISTN